MERPPLPRARLAEEWGGLPRECPRCGTRFVSRFHRGQCTKCGHVFSAMNEYGPPDSVDEEAIYRQLAHVSDDDSAVVMQHLFERVEDLPRYPDSGWSDPEVRDALANLVERWELQRYFVLEALEQGGELWRWCTAELPEAKRCCGGYAVVRDSRAVAVIPESFAIT